MIAPFDIFRVDPADGALVWCATADSLDSAKLRVADLNKVHRVPFVIISLKTGRRLTIDAPPAKDKPGSV